MNTEVDDIYIIIEGCKRNDRRAQERLYKRFYKAMAGICLRYTKNQEDATAVLNAGFLKVFKNITQYNSNKGAVFTWVKAIIVNTCLDHLKKMKNNIEQEELIETTNLSVLSETNAKIDLHGILHLIRKLPPATQAVFNLFVIEDYSHKEIATLLKISEGTSKWHLNDARSRLKFFLQNNMHN